MWVNDAHLQHIRAVGQWRGVQGREQALGPDCLDLNPVLDKLHNSPKPQSFHLYNGLLVIAGRWGETAFWYSMLSFSL